MDRSVEHKEVKSFAEQRAESATAHGMTCPKCRCAQTMVLNTRRMFGYVRRYRQCANPSCRNHFVTSEKLAK